MTSVAIVGTAPERTIIDAIREARAHSSSGLRVLNREQHTNPLRRVIAFDKAAALATAKAEGKTGARLQFSDKTEHGLLPTGQHIRLTSKIRGKAAQKAARRGRQMERAQVASLS